MDLTGFLDARISEDEAAADLTEYGRYERDMRTLAECKAKRAIMALHGDPMVNDDYYQQAWDDATDAILRIIAAVYSDHRDYDPTWAPE